MYIFSALTGPPMSKKNRSKYRIKKNHHPKRYKVNPSPELPHPCASLLRIQKHEIRLKCYTFASASILKGALF